MRSFFALSLLLTLFASANAATLHHAARLHHVIARPSQDFSDNAIPRSAYAAARPADHYDDTPSYNDPPKFGGSAALRTGGLAVGGTGRLSANYLSVGNHGVYDHSILRFGTHWSGYSLYPYDPDCYDFFLRHPDYPWQPDCM
jgi:hypothetical protein